MSSEDLTLIIVLMQDGLRALGFSTGLFIGFFFSRSLI